MKISRSVILAIAVSVLGLMAIGLGLTAFGGGCQAAHEKARHGVLAMDVFAQDAIVDLLLFEETPRGKELRHVRSRDGATTWSAPSTINRRGRGIVDHRRGMDPQIAAAGDTVVVLWTTPGTSAWGAGPLATAVSRDGGRTWTLGPNPADDTSNDGHSFLELAADETGAFQAFWLDSRNGAQGLRTAFSRDAGHRPGLPTRPSTHEPASAAGTRPSPSLRDHLRCCIATEVRATWRWPQRPTAVAPGRAGPPSGTSAGRSKHARMLAVGLLAHGLVPPNVSMRSCGRGRQVAKACTAWPRATTGGRGRSPHVSAPLAPSMATSQDRLHT